MMARPGLGQHGGSTTTLPTSSQLATPGQPWTSGTNSGTVTPGTPKKGYSGVDAHEVTRQLRKLREKIAHNSDTKHAKYIQAKADLAHRRNLVLLMVSTRLFLTYIHTWCGVPTRGLFLACRNRPLPRTTFPAAFLHNPPDCSHV